MPVGAALLIFEAMPTDIHGKGKQFAGKRGLGGKLGFDLVRYSLKDTRHGDKNGRSLCNQIFG